MVKGPRRRRRTNVRVAKRSIVNQARTGEKEKEEKVKESQEANRRERQRKVERPKRRQVEIGW